MRNRIRAWSADKLHDRSCLWRWQHGLPRQLLETLRASHLETPDLLCGDGGRYHDWGEDQRKRAIGVADNSRY